MKHVFLTTKEEANINPEHVVSISSTQADSYERSKYGSVCFVHLVGGICFRLVGDHTGMYEYLFENGGQPCY